LHIAVESRAVESNVAENYVRAESGMVGLGRGVFLLAAGREHQNPGENKPPER
jgi:hypothetical protein